MLRIHNEHNTQTYNVDLYVGQVFDPPTHSIAIVIVEDSHELCLIPNNGSGVQELKRYLDDSDCPWRTIHNGVGKVLAWGRGSESVIFIDDDASVMNSPDP
jgi:hypothetical protein